MLLNSYCLIFDIFSGNKKLYFLLNEFSFSMKKNWIIELPRFIKNIIIKSYSLIKKLGINYIWIFSEKKTCCFLCISKIPKGPYILFEIFKFSLKNEIKIFKKKKENFSQNPILLLNNFSSILEKELILEKILKELFFVEKKKKLILQKQKSAVFFDLIRTTNIIECRFYKFWGTSLLLPRIIRKNKYLNFQKKKKSQKFFRKQSNISLSQNTNYLYSLNIEEIGPRITLKLLEILEFAL